MTAIADPLPVAADVPTPANVTLSAPVVTLCADLMPEEILVRRRLGYLKRRLVFVMAALVALIVLGDLLVRQQTSSADSDLVAADNHIAVLSKQMTVFTGMLSTQNETEAIWTQLDGVMGNDVSWTDLLDQLARPAPPALRLASITAEVTDPNSAADATAPDTSLPLSANAVGSLTLTGIAPNWRSVATYVRGLSELKVFSGVNPSTVAHDTGSSGSGLAFTITIDLTDAALSNRYRAAQTSSPAGSTGGTPTGTTVSGTSAAGSTIGPMSTTPKASTSSTQNRPQAKRHGPTAKRQRTTKHRSARHGTAGHHGTGSAQTTQETS